MTEFNKESALFSYKKMRDHIHKCMQILINNGVDCSEIYNHMLPMMKTWRKTISDPKIIGRHTKKLYIDLHQEKSNKEYSEKKSLVNESILDKIKSLISNKKQKKSYEDAEKVHLRWHKKCDEIIKETDTTNEVFEKMDKAWKECIKYENRK